jgi:hypothetical protein
MDPLTQIPWKVVPKPLEKLQKLNITSLGFTLLFFLYRTLIFPTLPDYNAQEKREYHIKGHLLNFHKFSPDHTKISKKLSLP